MSDIFRRIDMSRAEWNKPAVFSERAEAMNVTVLMPQSKEKRLVQLALESLLRFYPDIPIFVIDNLGQDLAAPLNDSSRYLDWKSITHPNVKVWHRYGVNSHGMTMDEAIRQYIFTRYILLLDSDVIVERGGFIEPMLEEMEKDASLYAIGTYMPVSFSNDGCGGPRAEGDTLHYAHPSCSVYRRDLYLTFRPFTDHGAPCCYNCEDAQTQGYKVISWPVDDYVSHLSGASWTTPRTIWSSDHDVYLRPFVTFIIDSPDTIEQLQGQNDQDFDIVIPESMQEEFFCVFPISSKATSKHVKNDTYPLFYRVTGEYVCRTSASLSIDFVAAIKRAAMVTRGADVMNVGGVICHRRQYWQEYVCLNT